MKWGILRCDDMAKLVQNTRFATAAWIVVIMAVAVARVMFTYPVFSQTVDEGDHLAAGMQWWQEGLYTFEPLHTPLARIAIAALPYWAGLRIGGSGNMDIEGNVVLHQGGRYERNLTLARLGILPFFIVAVLLIWYWARSLFGADVGWVAVLLFTNLPAILAHSGLATTDMPVTAMLLGALVALCRWIQRPCITRSMVLGLAVALALLSKLTAVLFLPLAGLMIVACCWRGFSTLGYSGSVGDINRMWTHFAVFILTCFLTIWATYRFSLDPIRSERIRPHKTVDATVGDTGRLHDAVYRVIEANLLPATEFFSGIKEAHLQSEKGRVGYLLGDLKQGGWWYFFPLAFAVKTPIPFLVLVGLGGAILCVRASRTREFWVLAPLAGALSMLFGGLFSSINIGLRYVLPIYPLLAIVAAVGVVGLWQRCRGLSVGRIMAGTLLAWHVVSSVRAHPDYLSYFNEVAASDPGAFLVDSDLDWGQDLLRLRDELRRRKVERFAIAYFGGADLDEHNLPPFQLLKPGVQQSGWVAVSEFLLREKSEDYKWLTRHKPVALVGSSIRLYYIKCEPPIATNEGRC